MSRKSAQQIEQEIANCKLKQKQLNAQLRDIKNRQKTQERKWRTHELIVIGSIIESHFDGIDEIDLWALDEYLHKHRKALRNAASQEPTGARIANEACREYEQQKRELAREAKLETKRLQREVLDYDENKGDTEFTDFSIGDTDEDDPDFPVESNDDGWLCPNCGMEVQPDDQRCYHCGQEFAE